MELIRYDYFLNFKYIYFLSLTSPISCKISVTFPLLTHICGTESSLLQLFSLGISGILKVDNFKFDQFPRVNFLRLTQVENSKNPFFFSGVLPSALTTLILPRGYRVLSRDINGLPLSVTEINRGEKNLMTNCLINVREIASFESMKPNFLKIKDSFSQPVTYYILLPLNPLYYNNDTNSASTLKKYIAKIYAFSPRVICLLSEKGLKNVAVHKNFNVHPTQEIERIINPKLYKQHSRYTIILEGTFHEMGMEAKTILTMCAIKSKGKITVKIVPGTVPVEVAKNNVYYFCSLIRPGLQIEFRDDIADLVKGRKMVESSVGTVYSF